MEASTSNGRPNPASASASASVALESRGGSGSSPPPQAPQPVPIPIPSANGPPPFLVKTYEMVDDASTDKIVSWSSTNNSFVVWDQPEFTRNLLPKYFKHNNYSSFVRQLNTYGFRKVDPDRQEFANEGFLRGQKHLLKTISRRKSAQGHHVPQPQPQPQPQPPPPPPPPPRGENTSVRPCIEVGKFGLEEEVEWLKRDKNVLMQELVRLRQQQQTTDNQLQTMVQHLQGMEQRQQQMMSFLAKAVNSPGFLAQFVQQQNDSSRRIIERNKKRRLKQEDGLADQTVAATDGQIVKYQPMINEAAKAMLRQLVKLDPSPRLDDYLNTSDNFLISNGSASNPMDREFTNHLSAVSLQDIPPTSVHSSQPLPSPISFQNSSTYSSDIQQPPPLFGGVTSEISDVNPLIGADIIMPHPVSHLPGMSPEGDDDIFGADTSSSDMNGGISTLDSDDIVNQIVWGDNTLHDVEDTNDLPRSIDPFWEPFLKCPSHALETEEIDSSILEDLSKGIDIKPQQVNGWDETQNLEQLTTQMSYLA